MVRVGVLAVLAFLVAGAVPAFSSSQAQLRELDPAAVGALPMNPTAYAREKAAANAGYAKWAQQHGVKPARDTAVSGALNQPGLDAGYSGDRSTTPTPPDTTGSIGPSNYVEMVNEEIGVYSNTDLTATPTKIAESTFVSDASPCDGQIQWDQEGQRWIYALIGGCGGDDFGAEKLLVGFSKGTSPLPLTSSNWCQYSIPTGSNFEDYDKLGHDDTQILIGANEYGNDGFGAFNAGKVFVLPKPAAGTIATCPTQSVEVTSGLKTLTLPDAFTPVPANIADSSANGYVVANDVSSNSQLDLYTITSSATTGTMSPTTVVSVPTYATPPSVPESGTTDTLDSLDGRLTQAVAATDPDTTQEGIWTQHTVAGSNGGPSVVRWYELTPGDTTPTQVGTVKGPNNSFAFMGAISPSTNGSDAAIFYNSSSSSSLPDFRVQDRHRYTTSGTMVEDLQLGTSSSPDEDFSCDSFPSDGIPCRWGDYNAASPDPSNPSLVWGTGELITLAPDGPDNLSDAQWGSENAAIDVTPAANYTLNVATAGHGSGSITSGDTQISCPGTCSHSYPYNTPVALTATATPGTHSNFVGWSGDCTGTGTCNLPMGGPQSVTATFTLDQEALAYTKSGNGSGSVTSSPSGLNCSSSCSPTFDYGTSVELTAAPSTGSSFAGWSGDCTVVNGKCDVSMQQAHNVTATFTLVPEALTVSKAGAGSGTVASTVAGINCGSTCSNDWNYGTSVTLTATPATGSAFVGWSGACSGTGNCTVSLNGAKSVTATFALIPETLNVTKAGNSTGTVSSSPAGIDCGTTCSTSFGYGTSVTLTATPGSNATFAGWSGACSGTGDCTVPLTAAAAVTATFQKILCHVPNVKGKTLSAAKSALSAGHCSVGKVRKTTSKTVKKGKVISQQWPAGATKPEGTTVKLVVSSGKPKK